MKSSLHSQRFWVLAHLWMMNCCVKSGALFEFLDMKTPKFMNQKLVAFVFFFSFSFFPEKSKEYGPCVASVVPVSLYVLAIQVLGVFLEVLG